MKDRPNLQQKLQENRESLKTRLNEFLDLKIPDLLNEDYSNLTPEEKKQKATELTEEILSFEREINRFFGNTPEYNTYLWKLWNKNHLDNYFTILEKLGETEEEQNTLARIYKINMRDLAEQQEEEEILQEEVKSSVSTYVPSELDNLMAEIVAFNKSIKEQLLSNENNYENLKKIDLVNTTLTTLNALSTRIDNTEMSNKNYRDAKYSLWNYRLSFKENEPSVVAKFIEKFSLDSNKEMLITAFNANKKQELEKADAKMPKQDKQKLQKNTEWERRKKIAQEYGKKTLKAASFLTVPTLIGQALYHGINKGMKEWDKRKKPEPEDTTPKMRKK